MSDGKAAQGSDAPNYWIVDQILSVRRSVRCKLGMETPSGDDLAASSSDAPPQKVHWLSPWNLVQPSERLAPSPFHMTLAERNEALYPNIFDAFSNFTRCARNNQRTDTLSFWDGSVYLCGQQFVNEASYSVQGDDASKAWIDERRRIGVDPSKLPWETRPQYREYLQRVKRLDETQMPHPGSP